MRLLTSSLIVLLLSFYNVEGQKLATQLKPKPGRVKNATAVRGRCAVIVQPSAAKIKSLRKGLSGDEYMTLVSDNQYYLGSATAYLTSIKVRQLEKQSTGVLSFRSVSGQYFKVSLDRFDWGIILFNGHTKPVEADVTDIEASYGSYMKK